MAHIEHSANATALGSSIGASSESMITNHSKKSLVAFEQRIVSAFAAGDLPYLVHLSGGNEEQLLSLFEVIAPDDWVFSTHRNHHHALLKGIPEHRLEALIHAGKSMFVFSAEHRFATSSILAGVCPIAAGVALDIKRRGGSERVWCFVGDGAEDNGHFAEAVRFATARDLPIVFIIEDNGRQVDTTYGERWGDEARWNWGPKVRRLSYTPTFPHGGAGLPPGSVTFKPEAISRFLYAGL